MFFIVRYFDGPLFFIIGSFYFLLGKEEGEFFSLWGQIKYPLRYFASPFSSNVVLIIEVDVKKTQTWPKYTQKRAEKRRKTRTRVDKKVE